MLVYHRVDDRAMIVLDVEREEDSITCRYWSGECYKTQDFSHHEIISNQERVEILRQACSAMLRGNS